MNNPQPIMLNVVDDTLRVEGALDFAAAARLSPMLRKCIANLPAAFTVDLSGLVAFNSAVLAFMLDCVRVSSAANKRCEFSGAPLALGNLLKMASLADLVNSD